MNSDNLDDRDDLWDLLGHARQAEVSPFFARNVVREARASRRESSGWFEWALRSWQMRTASACALAIVLGASVLGGRTTRVAVSEDSQLMTMAEKVSASPDYQVIGELDELLDSEQNSVWLSADAN
jgi:hypothetical protein